VIQIDRQTVSPSRHGYAVPYIYQLNEGNDYTVHGDINICNFALTDSFQIRWLVNGRAGANNVPPLGVSSLDDVQFTLISESTSYTFLNDSFTTTELE